MNPRWGLGRFRLPGLGGWGDDPLWGAVYDWSVEHPRVGGPAWVIVAGSDLSLLHAAAARIGALPAGSRVLDVPCGGGVALRGVRPGQGLTYLAADLSPVMLRRTSAVAREVGVADQVTLVAADVGALPVPSASIDLVVSFMGLHCFPDPRRAVAEMARVLAPGGRLIGSTLLDDSGPRYLPLMLGGRAAGLIGPGVTGPQLVAWLEDDGLVDVRLRRSGAVGYVDAHRATVSPVA